MRARQTIICLLATLLIAAPAAKAEAPVNIPDPGVKAGIEARLGVVSPGPNDMLTLEWVNLSNRAIEDLTGLEYAKNLIRLDLFHNEIADISALTGLTSLRVLTLYGNPLSAKTCLIDIPAIRANNPGIMVEYDGWPEQQRTLAISSSSGGSVVMPGEGIVTFNYGQTVPVEAVPDAGHQFTHWSGTPVDAGMILNPSAPHICVFVEGDHSLMAHFKPQDEPWRTVYFNDLDGVVGPEWSHDRVDVTPVGGRQFLGQFNNETVTLTLSGLPPHTHVRVSFDLFVIRTWDGDQQQGHDPKTGAQSGGIVGPDIWKLEIPGAEVLLETSFANWPYYAQSYPANVMSGSFPAGTGSSEVGTLRYIWEGWFAGQIIDSVYHLSFPCLHAGDQLTCQFSAYGLQDISDESWGLDNVRIEIFDTEIELTTSSTAGGSVVMPGEGVFSYAWGESVPVEAVADEGWQFTHWSGTAVDPNVMLDPCAPHTSVLMDADYSLTAHFKPQDEPWSTVYFNDFEGAAGPEWSHNLVDATPIGERRFLGQFHNDTVTLTLTDLPPHTNVRLTFDLFVIRTWDGDFAMLNGQLAGGHGYGPDVWSVVADDGLSLLETTFSNQYLPEHTGSKQSYPYAYGSGLADAMTGTGERNSLGYLRADGTPMDSVYHITLVWSQPTDHVSVSFSASGLDMPSDNENWGLDNVRVEILHADVELTTSSTERGSVVMPGEGMFTCTYGSAVPVEAVAEEGYEFTHWSGTAVDANALLDPSAIHTSVTVDANYTLVAHFKPQDEPWSTVYFNDFEGEVGPEWSHNLVDATIVGARRFLGQFNKDTVTLTLAGLPSHQSVRLTFDLFLLHSWDGDGVPAPPGMRGGPGPDLWSLTVNGSTKLLETTFDNHSTPEFVSYHRQSYPDEYPGPGVLPFTGAAEIGSLGYAWTFEYTAKTDSVYHLSFVVEDPGPSIRFDFAATGLQPIRDESWGLDNVHVEVLAPAVSEATLTISSTAGGSVATPGEGQFKYPLGTVVPVQASAEAGYHFTHWSGTAVEAGKVGDGASASTTVTVDGDCTLVANFAPDQKSLTISSTAGGFVTVPGAGAFQYAQGISVAIQAMAETNHHFTHWSGTAVDTGKVADPTSASTTVVVDGDYTLVANFAIDQHALAVSSTAGGSVTDPGEGTFACDHGLSITITAAAEANHHFTHWSGSAVDAGAVANPASATTTVIVNADYTLVANFAVDQKTLTVSAEAGGSVTAPGQSSFQYPHGASVPVQAVAQAHYQFTHWSGTAVDAGKVADPTAASTSVTVDADYTLVANFRIDQHRLTVTAAEGGYIYVETRVGDVMKPWYDGPVPPLDHGTEVTVIATPYSGWKFTGWGGTMGSTESPFTFELTQDCDLEALFVPE